jgi:hypothetical protein
MTPIPQNYLYPLEKYISSNQSIVVQHQQALDRRDQHVLSHKGGCRLSPTFLSRGLQAQSESFENMLAL